MPLDISAQSSIGPSESRRRSGYSVPPDSSSGVSAPPVGGDSSASISYFLPCFPFLGIIASSSTFSAPPKSFPPPPSCAFWVYLLLLVLTLRPGRNCCRSDSLGTSSPRLQESRSGGGFRGNPREHGGGPLLYKRAARLEMVVVWGAAPTPQTLDISPGSGFFFESRRVPLVLLCSVWASCQAWGMRANTPFILPTRFPGSDGLVTRSIPTN